MDHLKELIKTCKTSVSVEVNKHRVVYETAEQQLTMLRALDDQFMENIDEDVYQRMVDTDTIVSVRAYSLTPTAFFECYHYDLEAALKDVYKSVMKEKSDNEGK